MIAEGWLERLRLRGGRRKTRIVVSRGPRGRPATTRLSRRRPSPAALAVVGALLALLLGGWLWLRDSSLVAVKRVTITGVSGPDARKIRSALQSAARNMTTLDVQMSALNTAVAPYPIVKGLRVSTHFPHGLAIRVVEQVPVGAISVDGRSMPVAADGTVLHDVVVAGSLPLIPLRVPPGGSKLSDPEALGAVAVLAAAPEPLRARVGQVSSTAANGFVAQLRNGPAIYFGDTTRLDAKWIAAAAVLADSGSSGALYIDVTDPSRPAAGAGTSSTTTAGATGATSSAGATGATSPANATGATSTASSTGATSTASATSASVATGAIPSNQAGTPPTGSTATSTAGGGG